MVQSLVGLLAMRYTGKMCEIEGCTKVRKYKTLCGTHYERFRLHGSYDKPKRTLRSIPIESRFWKHVDKTDECWFWTGTTDKNGYGLTRVNGVFKRAHIVSCMLSGRSKPPGLVADHICHTQSDCVGGNDCVHRRCVNPDHIRFTTRKLNALDGKGAAMEAFRNKTCQRGHPRTPEHTYWRLDRPGKMECRTCAKERARNK